MWAGLAFGKRFFRHGLTKVYVGIRKLWEFLAAPTGPIQKHPFAIFKQTLTQDIEMSRKLILLGMATGMTLFFLLPDLALAVWTDEPDYHHSAICGYDRDLIWDNELAAWYDAYVPDDAIQSFLFGQSFSGGFINDLATGPQRVIATSSDWNLPAYSGHEMPGNGFVIDPPEPYTPRGATHFNTFWDEAVHRYHVTANDTYLEAYNYAKICCPSFSMNLPQYYSANSTLDGLKLDSAAGDKYAILYVGLVKSNAKLALELAEIDFIRNTLIDNYGYNSDNITVLFNEGTGASYIDGAASKANLYAAVSNRGIAMDSTDSLFLWVSDQGADCSRPSEASTSVHPPEVIGQKILNFNIVKAAFDTGGGFTEDVELKTFTQSCNGEQDSKQVNDNVFLWRKGYTYVVCSKSISSHSECAGCTADAMALQDNEYKPITNGWEVSEYANVFAAVVVEGEGPAGNCIAHAELCKTLAATNWIAGNIFWLNLQLDVSGKLVAPGGPGGQAFLQWYGGLDVVGLENLWELEIAIEDDLLVVDFSSEDVLGLDDAAIETMIYDAFEQDGNLWWQADLIDLGNIPITICESNWELNSVLIAHAQASCPEPSTLCLLAIGALCASVLWRWKRR